MASIVVLSLLISTTALVIPTGSMAPPYHLNQSFYCDYFYQSSSDHYAIHGDKCDDGLRCGVFSASLNDYSGRNRWYIGAAISFKP